MNRNVLLLKRNKKNQSEMLKKLREETQKKLEFKRLNDPDPNKHNPDIAVKYQEDKNKRTKIIKPSGFKVENVQIKEEKIDLNNILQQKIQERNKKIEIPEKTVKKRIISGPSGNYESQKETINKIKKDMEEKIEKGKQMKDSILDFYKN